MAKNIFEKFDFDAYRQALQAAKEDGIHLLHTFDPRSHKGGYTIAWQRDGDNPNSTMINVAVSYCSPKDYFARKIGAYNALVNAYSGKFIQMPIGSDDSNRIVSELRLRFDRKNYY